MPLLQGQQLALKNAGYRSKRHMILLKGGKVLTDYPVVLDADGNPVIPFSKWGNKAQSLGQQWSAAWAKYHREEYGTTHEPKHGK